MTSKAQQFLSGRRTDYVQTFNTPHGEKVLDDLAKFCRAHESTFHADPRVHAALEGRREVWLRIQQHLNLNDETLWRIYGAATLQPSKE